ncbi:MAG: glycine cleavage system protein H, partial [Pirellulaceae bacterium]|nr:glycine cleavage system protein H [Pirellulaceae bacterium]
MSDLVFMMGEYEAVIPSDRRYARNHMWAKPHNDSEFRFGFRFGFTAYAVRLLQDVYFLDWTVDEGAALNERQQIGAIESKKAESDLFSPVGGVLSAFNAELLSDPSAINVDKYEQGWLFDMASDGESLLSPE